MDSKNIEFGIRSRISIAAGLLLALEGEEESRTIIANVLDDAAVLIELLTRERDEAREKLRVLADMRQQPGDGIYP